MNKCDRMQFRFGDARDWFHGLPCLICRNAIDSFDQSSEGGGTNNLPFVCAAREDVNDAIAHEVSMYGYVGEGTKLVAQTGYSLDFEDSLPEGLEFVAEETELILTDELFKAIDDVHAGSDWTEVIRDSMWESIDQLLEAMPKMELIPSRGGVLCDAANGGAHCLDCEIELCLCKEGVARILKDWEWTIRYEAEVARDVQWKAQRGGCMNFEEATPECPVCGNRKDSSYIKCPICKGVGMLLTPEAEIEMDYYLDRSPGWTGKQTADKKMYRHIRLLQEFFALESAEYVSWRTPIEEPSDSLPSEGNLESWIVEHSRVLLESEAPEAVWMLIAHSNNPTCVTQPAMM